ncbi:hypothetical protein QBC33DRAFT_550256 [Phialemonium atrogriseum]|uniref:Zn(2)-C6 fungal-type domain-containing protein n=1 Tax=Phialemonium atrogriseum TaxID=1093897 RepID=A0AAJ0BRQ4_9PEZI|nr:uncharacterized protein QBC33DRAFT_550256 [Phialemonium atrogriseum]KAK1763254.1 hypothetical protein QBC33DRAFT_550256 [Phialemonium atrogriseum]
MGEERMVPQVGEAPRKRRRARVACVPCRERKRRCNGQDPCGTCTEFEYDCHYAASARAGNGRPSMVARQGLSPDSAPPISPLDGSETRKSHGTRGQGSAGGHIALPEEARAHVQSLEANSGAAFARKLGLNIDPNNAPRLSLFAWNTGQRLGDGYVTRNPRPITSILSHAEMTSLSQTYFEKVAVVYGFIDRNTFLERLDQRWATDRGAVDPYDQVLCGVAALGLHFSQPSPPAIEPDLVESARALLEQESLSSPPSIDTVAGWVLRVAYLRMAATPHATWLASCSLMHVAEAARVHQEVPSQTVFDESPEAVNVDVRRRLWGMAQHLNIWASFDLGRARITLPNASTRPLTPKHGDPTSQLLGLMPLTEVLDPNQTRSAEDLESDLAQLLDQVHEVPPLVMAHVNLVLCVFRRLRAQKPSRAHCHIEKVLSLVQRGLQAARRMVSEYCPWHHAANIPFQVICLLLALDSRASLKVLHEALSVLKQVRDTWTSAVMQEAYDTAYLLILLHQRRKEEDAKELRAILDMHSSPMTHDRDGSNRANNAEQTTWTDSVESLWLDDFFTNVPGLREFDFEQLLLVNPG